MLLLSRDKTHFVSKEAPHLPLIKVGIMRALGWLFRERSWVTCSQPEGSLVAFQPWLLLNPVCECISTSHHLASV